MKITKNNKITVKKALNTQTLQALEACGMLGETNAKENIQQKKIINYGELLNSITHKVVASEKSVYIGTNTKYAPYIEMGTGIYYPSGRKTPWAYKDKRGRWHKTKGMKARPYLKPAVADHKEEYKKVIDKYIKK